jgi:hypothetical protein
VSAARNAKTNQAFILRASTATGTVAQIRTIPGAYVTLAASGNNVLLGGSMNVGTLNEPPAVRERRRRVPAPMVW